MSGPRGSRGRARGTLEGHSDRRRASCRRHDDEMHVYRKTFECAKPSLPGILTRVPFALSAPEHFPDRAPLRQNSRLASMSDCVGLAPVFLSLTTCSRAPVVSPSWTSPRWRTVLVVRLQAGTLRSRRRTDRAMRARESGSGRGPNRGSRRPLSKCARPYVRLPRSSDRGHGVSP